MYVTPLLSLLLVICLVAGAAALLMRQFAHGEGGAVAQARLHATRTSVTALVVGLLAAVTAGAAVLFPMAPLASGVGRPGVAAMTLPLAFGIAHTGTILVGELTWPRPGGLLQRARLVHRGLTQAIPAWLLWSALSTVIAGVAVIAVGAVTADTYGRSITVHAGNGLVEGAASPFVGWGYGSTALVGLGCLVVLTVAALWVVAIRPAVVTDHADVEAALRRASAQRVLRGSTAAAMVLVGGLVAVSGVAVRNASSGAAEAARLNDLPVGAAASLLPWVGGALALVGLVIGAAGVGVLFARAPRPEELVSPGA